MQTKGLFKDFNMSKYFGKKPPKNTSIRTYQELMYLKDLPEDLEYVKEHDDVENVFKEVCSDNNVDFQKI